MRRSDNRHMSEDQVWGAIDAAIDEYLNMSNLESSVNIDAIRKYSYWLFKYSGLVTIEFEQVEEDEQ